MEYETYSAGTLEELGKLSDQQPGALHVVAQLTEEERHSSASKWKLRHLIAYRLLTSPERPFLEIVKTLHVPLSQCPSALNFCLSQNRGSSESEVRPRIERKRATYHLAGKLKIVAEDDGGICRMLKWSKGWEMTSPYLALLEAKRAFKYIRYVESTDTHIPIQSDEAVAQYLAEAVAVWATDPEMKHGVFLIAATNTFLSFVHFRFSSHYREYLDKSGNEDAQKALINDGSKDTCVHMSSSPAVAQPGVARGTKSRHVSYHGAAEVARGQPDENRG